MTNAYVDTMQTLYRMDIWAGYKPARPHVKVEGWNGLHPTLAKLAVDAKPHIIIDVGVWKGQSTIFLAKALKEAGLDGCVLGVDTFLGSAEHWTGKQQASIGEYERHQGMPDIFEQFVANVWYNEVSDYVIPIPQTSSTAARILQKYRIKAGLIHLDASHHYADVVADIEAYWPIVAAGGYLLGDDFGWAGVKQAAEEFSQQVGLPLTVTGPKWFVRKAKGKAT